MSQQARVVHHIAGRLRLKLADAKRNPVLLEQIQAAIESLPDATSVELNPLTGSVLVCYTGEGGSMMRQLSTAGAKNGLFDLSPDGAPDREHPTHRRITAKPQGGARFRRLASRSLLALGIAGVLLPVVPGTPFLIAGAALLGSNDPIVRRSIEFIRRMRAKLRNIAA